MKTCQIILSLFPLLLISSKCEELSLVCFASCEIYTDGKLIQNVANIDWWKPKKITLEPINFIAARVSVLDGKGGLMIKSLPEGSFDTDGSRWKCHGEEKSDITWTKLNYDDGEWPSAEMIALNGDCKFLSNNNSKFNCIDDLNEYAAWIWVPPKQGNFYCRLDITKTGKGINLGVNALKEETDWFYPTKGAIIFGLALLVLIIVIIVVFIIKRNRNKMEESEEE